MPAEPSTTNPAAARAAAMRVIDAHRELRQAAHDVATYGNAAQQQAARDLMTLCQSLWRPVATLGATV